MTPHALAVAGDDPFGPWSCTRCAAPFLVWVDGRGPCGPQRSFPWAADRVALFRAAVRRVRAQASQRAMSAGADAAARWDTRSPVGVAAGASVRGSALVPAASRVGGCAPPSATDPTHP